MYPGHYATEHPDRAAFVMASTGAAVTYRADTLAAAAGLPPGAAAFPPGFSPRPNVGPGVMLPLITAADDGGTRITHALWGVPGHGGGLLINARSETAASTPTWRRMLAAGRRSRGVLVVDGYYEWKAGGARGKQPFFVHSKAGGRRLALACVVDAAPSPPRFVVVTTAPPRELAWLHDRAPAVLGEASPDNAAVRAWLDGATAPCALRPVDGDALAWHPVTRAVGSVSYQGSDAMKDVRAGGLAAAWAKAGKGEGGGGPASPPMKKEEDGGRRSPGKQSPERRSLERPPPAAVKQEGGKQEGGVRSPPSPPSKKRAAGQASLDAFLKSAKKGK